MWSGVLQNATTPDSSNSIGIPAPNVSQPALLKPGLDKESVLRIWKEMIETRDIRGTGSISIKVRYTNREDATSRAVGVVSLPFLETCLCVFDLGQPSRIDPT